MFCVLEMDSAAVIVCDGSVGLFTDYVMLSGFF